MSDKRYIEPSKSFALLEHENVDLREELTNLQDELDQRIAQERLNEMLTMRAKYHGTEEFGRQFVIVKYMDERVSELERIANLQAAVGKDSK